MVAVEDGGGAHRGNVGPGILLRGSERQDGVPVVHSAQRSVAPAREEPAYRGLDPRNDRAADVRRGELLDGYAQARVVAFLPAERLRPDDAEDARLAHLADRFERQFARLVPLARMGPQFALSEFAHVLAIFLVLTGKHGRGLLRYRGRNCGD